MTDGSRAAVHRPADEAEAGTVLREAAASRTPLRIVGADTKSGLGRPAQDAATLSTAALAGITLHEPAELVVAARSGTPLREVVERLAAHRQVLPFEPMDHRPLFGSEGEPTIGAVAAANLSGPRRIMAGAARDALIGVRFVNGRGEAVKSGGRVMKNVTGLDLVKLLAGSYGTLGLLTEVTFKVEPAPERVATLALAGLEDEAGVAALAAGLGSPFAVTGAAHLPPGLADDRALTLLRVEGFTASVAYRLGELARLLRRSGTATVMDDGEAAALWGRVRDAALLAEPRERAVWRISTAPSRAPALAASIGAARHFYDWGGGLLWAALDAAGDGPWDAGASTVRAAVAQAGGHATLVRAPASVRAAVPVFQPLAEPLMRVTRAIKAAHDPAGILNPGRMYAGV